MTWIWRQQIQSIFLLQLPSRVDECKGVMATRKPESTEKMSIAAG